MPDEQSAPTPCPRVSVVVVAHNEERNIGRLLDALTRGARPGELDVVVACNGCTDRTVEIALETALATALATGPVVRVLELPAPSKRDAQRAGDEAARWFPRAYVDGDVLVSLQDLRELAAPLDAGRALASAPARRLDSAASSWLVRSYYRVWECLPQVASGLFGRGVVMVSREGAARVLQLPRVLSDDLAMSEAFTPGERVVVDTAHVVVAAPRTVRDLVRRRVRVATGNTQADRLGLRKAHSTTRFRTLVDLARQDPRLLPDLVVFAGVTVVARRGARRRVRAGDFTTWLRDESSRQLPTVG